jgi:large subunit ribosomal protein L6
MSRVGRLPIGIASGVEVKIEGQKVSIKGPKGSLSLEAHRNIKVSKQDNQIVVKRSSDAKFDKSLHGLTRNLIHNMCIGVTVGFQKELEINGIGYKAAVKGKNLSLSLGHSHPIDYPAPEGISFEVEKNRVLVKGIDKELVGRVASEIRGFRKIEPYKGKGIKYVDEKVKRKVGKTA